MDIAKFKLKQAQKMDLILEGPILLETQPLRIRGEILRSISSMFYMSLFGSKVLCKAVL